MAAFFSHNVRQLAFARKLAARPPCQRQQDRARDFKPNDHGKQEAYGGSRKQATSRMGDFQREKVGALDRGGQGGVAEGLTDGCRRDFQPGSPRQRPGHVNEAIEDQDQGGSGNQKSFGAARLGLGPDPSPARARHRPRRCIAMCRPVANAQAGRCPSASAVSQGAERAASSPVSKAASPFSTCPRAASRRSATGAGAAERPHE